MALLGLAVAFSSPTSVAAVLIVLGMPSGRRRGYAFVGGWLAAIALVGVIVLIFPTVDFRSSSTSPSRAASIAEIVIGGFLIAGAVALHRRPEGNRQKTRDPIPGWLVRLVGRHWAVALVAGGVMLTKSLTIVAILEILKANVDALHRSLALVVFALTSIVTITAPIVYATVAPQRAAADLESWKHWLTDHSRIVGVTLLVAIGLAIIVKALHDLFF